MMLSPLINDCTRTNRSRRRSTSNACARAKPPILPADPPQTSPRNAPPASQSRTHQQSHRSNRFNPE
jgi:hypothetical protein